jgi:hypothetical protein
MLLVIFILVLAMEPERQVPAALPRRGRCAWIVAPAFSGMGKQAKNLILLEKRLL